MGGDKSGGREGLKDVGCCLSARSALIKVGSLTEGDEGGSRNVTGAMAQKQGESRAVKFRTIWTGLDWK